MLGRRVLLALLVPYVLWLIFAYEYHLVDGVNLATHEVGHIVFGFLGRTMHFLGGSIGQMVFPVAFAIGFWRKRQRFDAAVMAIWSAESLMYLAEYLGDAQAQRLPLVGGHMHDWNWLLTKAGLLDQCELIAAGVHGAASLLAIAAVCVAGYAVRFGQANPSPFDELPADWDERRAA